MMLRRRTIDLIAEKCRNNSEVVRSLLLPTIGLKPNTEQANFVSSKIGGHPPILESNWPFFGNKPLTHLVQIDLQEISGMNTVLPKKGILCFFLYTGDIGYRYPDRMGEFRVLYIENIESFKSNQALFRKRIESISEYSVSFFEYYTFPTYQESLIRKNNIAEEELDSIDEIEGEILFLINGNSETEHQLLGYPRALQGPVSFWWAVKYLGLEEKYPFSNMESKLISEEEENFVLLLQLNFGDPRIEIDYFGDSVAYFGIHKKDLQIGNFDNVVLVMQNI